MNEWTTDEEDDGRVWPDFMIVNEGDGSGGSVMREAQSERVTRGAEWGSTARIEGRGGNLSTSGKGCAGDDGDAKRSGANGTGGTWRRRGDCGSGANGAG